MNTTFSETDLKSGSLANHFLIAMPGLVDPNFSHTITYICEHSAEGAMGLVINHALPMQFEEVLEQMGIEDHANVGGKEILSGGPVQLGRGFVLHTSDKQWPSTMRIADDVFLTASRDILEDIANNCGPDRSLVILGYAGWEAGQLEREIAENAWLTVPADSRILFDTDTPQRWQAASDCVGVDLNLISSCAGHA
ncbi:YqgE/AlgH family protein [Halioxenophilus sp. WMMB6]|uniref:YqgE/AlgH family protein n=1 Tax=Halioxenophilus sp. WMMB6 TaxID=3073815 RepID=UPI00295E30AB|nr:YqgE/AlgH family protein [Halioxenophilus sp. WMMB6]